MSNDAEQNTKDIVHLHYCRCNTQILQIGFVQFSSFICKSNHFFYRQVYMKFRDKKWISL